ncbi:MAG: STAS domain-containing protein [Gemmatimonadales bacterium]
MRIDVTREGDSATLQLEGRLDREWAEHLAVTLDDLLHQGVRSLNLDFAEVTYVSSAATEVLGRVHQELVVLRGEVRLTSLSPAVRNAFDIAGWDPTFALTDLVAAGALRRSSWHARADFARSGQYEVAGIDAHAALVCRPYGDPGKVSQGRLEPGDCSSVALGDNAFGLGVGAIGGGYDECRGRLGELVAVAGCVAHFPSDGARKPDYLLAGGQRPAEAVLASGLVCDGGFSQLVRFSAKPESEAVPLSELAAVCLRASGSAAAGVVIAGEAAGLTGAKLTRSPDGNSVSSIFELPALREWLSFAPEPTHAMTTTLIVGVVARAPEPALAPHLRPLGDSGELAAHFHALVFAYRPLPHRTVELRALVGGLFADHRLRDVLHLVSDDRGERGVAESALVRGVAWVGPIARAG